MEDPSGSLTNVKYLLLFQSDDIKDEMAFTCLICDGIFDTKFTLTLHMDFVHKEEKHENPEVLKMEITPDFVSDSIKTEQQDSEDVSTTDKGVYDRLSQNLARS